MSAPIIKAENLVIFAPRSKQVIVGPLSFSLEAGENLVVRGPNGAGKTTLLRCLSGQHPSFSGRLQVRVPTRRWGVLPQLANVRFHLPMTLEDVLSVSSPDLSKRDLIDKATDLGLLSGESLSRDWNSASGGERQRVLLTRLFLNEPDLLILDEPGNHLDHRSREKLALILQTYLARDKNHDNDRSRSLIMVTHEEEIHRSIPHRELRLTEVRSDV